MSIFQDPALREDRVSVATNLTTACKNRRSSRPFGVLILMLQYCWKMNRT
jgi:hypothetical protein